VLAHFRTLELLRGRLSRGGDQGTTMSEGPAQCQSHAGQPQDNWRKPAASPTEEAGDKDPVMVGVNLCTDALPSRFAFG